MLVITKSVVYKQETMWMGNLEGQKRIHTSVRFYDNEMHDEEKQKKHVITSCPIYFYYKKKKKKCMV